MNGIGMNSRRNTVVGLDIGTTSVKLVALRDDKGELVLLKAQRIPIDPTDKEDSLTRALREALSGVFAKGARLVSVVTDPQGSFHRLAVPRMPKSELREALSWELKDRIPAEAGDVEFDYEILRPLVEKGVKKWEMLVALLPKEAVRHHLSLLQKVEASPSRLIQGPVALQSLFKRRGLGMNEPVAVLEMGYCASELSVFWKGALEFSRRVPVSGADFTKALTVSFQLERGGVALTLEEAEQMKCAYGLSQEESRLPLIRPVAERLSSEIERSLVFHQEQSDGGKVGRLLLFGAAASLKGLDIFLSESLGIEVSLANPFEGLPFSSPVWQGVPEAPQEFALALGAAFSGKSQINLLPQEMKEQTRRLLKRSALKGTATSCALLLLFLYAGMRIEMTNRHKKIAVTKLELSALTPLLDEAGQKALLKEVLNREPYWGDLFRELSHIVPEQVYLRTLRSDGERLFLEGIIVTEEENPERLLSGLLATMEKGIFKKAALVETVKLEGGKGSSFKIQAELD